MEENRSGDILLGLFTLLVVGALAFLSLKVGSIAPQGAVHYDFLMDSALGLQRDNRVSVAGVNVGVVDDLAVDGKMARVSVLLDPALVLHADAKAAVRARTLLGEKYVDLDPGSADEAVLSPGSTLKDNIPTVEIDQVIRAAAALVDSMNGMAPTMKQAVDRLDAVLATADMRQVAKDLGSLIKDGAEVVRLVQRTVADSGQDARVLLRDLRERTPAILDRIEKTGQRVDALLASVPQDALNSTIDKAPGTMDSANAALADIRLAVAEIRATSQRTSKTLESLDRVLAKAGTVTEQQIREVLQVEGVRVNLITDPDIERRVRALSPPTPSLPGKR